MKPSLHLTKNFSDSDNVVNASQASSTVHKVQSSLLIVENISSVSCAFNTSSVHNVSYTSSPLYSRHEKIDAQKKIDAQNETSNASGGGAADTVTKKIDKRTLKESRVTTDKNGRMWFSLKGKRYGSKVNETEEQFLDRVRGDKAIQPKEIMNYGGEAEMPCETLSEILQQNNETPSNPIKEETVEIEQPTEPVLSDEDNFFARIKAQFDGPTYKLRTA